MLGTATDQERQEVECMMHIYPEIYAHFEELEAAMQGFAEALATPPRAEVRKRVLELISATPQDGEQEATPTVSIAPAPTGRLRYLSAAASAAAVILAVLWFNTRQSEEATTAQLAELQERQERNQSYTSALEDSTSKLTSERDQERKINAVLADAATRRVALDPVQPGTQATVAVFWNTDNHAVLLQVESLPPVPEGKQYQLWAIVDGAPTDMGMLALDLTSDAVVEMPYQVQGAQAFAITLEEAGGSPTPNLDALAVLGNV